MVGKWHVGYSHDPAPGYDYWYTHRLGGGSYFDAPIWEFDDEAGRTTTDPRETAEPRYFTDAIGDHAVDFLRRHAADDQERPFFLQLSTTAPHAPSTNGNHPAHPVPGPAARPSRMRSSTGTTTWPGMPQPAAASTGCSPGCWPRWRRRDSWRTRSCCSPRTTASPAGITGSGARATAPSR